MSETKKPNTSVTENLDPQIVDPAESTTSVVRKTVANRPTTSSQKDDLLAYYLAEVRQYPLLDPQEEKELAIRYLEDGDQEAAQRLVTANLRLVVKLAFQYHRQWANVLDLIQLGAPPWV